MKNFPILVKGIPALLFAPTLSDALRLQESSGLGRDAFIPLESDITEHATVISAVRGIVNRNRIITQNSRPLRLMVLVPQALDTSAVADAVASIMDAR